MRAGLLRHRLKVQEPVETKNSVGEPIKEWTDVKTIWGEIEPIRGEERYSLMQAKAAADTIIRARAMATDGVTTKMRFVHVDRNCGETIYDIDANLNWRTRGIMREIFCKEAAA